MACSHEYCIIRGTATCPPNCEHRAAPKQKNELFCYKLAQKYPIDMPFYRSLLEGKFYFLKKKLLENKDCNFFQTHQNS